MKFKYIKALYTEIHGKLKQLGVTFQAKFFLLKKISDVRGVKLWGCNICVMNTGQLLVNYGCRLHLIFILY